MTSNRTGILKNIINKDHIEVLIKEILNFLMSIPRSYSVYFPLTGLQSSPNGKIVLDDNFAIVRFSKDDIIPGGVQLEGALASLVGGGYAQTLMPNMTYACIKGVGYSGGFHDDSACVDAISKFKQIVHLGIVFKGFVLQKENYDLGNERTAGAIIFDNTDLSQPVSVLNLPLELTRYIERIKEAPLTGLAAVGSATLNKERKLTDLLRIPISFMKIVDHDSTAVIKTAIEWAFDSSIGKNETIAFLQACIGIEAILSDDAVQELITERLADRCAYLLGNNIAERKEIRKKLKDLYKVRSKIVHGRAKRLNNNESQYLYLGREILNGMIAKEVANLTGGAGTII